MDWGRNEWYAMTARAYAYPTRKPTPVQKKAFKEYYENAAETLPCEHCREHWSELLKKHPLTPEVLASRRSLTRWLNTMHNEVNDHVRSIPVSDFKVKPLPWAKTHPQNPSLSEIDKKFKVKTKTARKSMKSK